MNECTILFRLNVFQIELKKKENAIINSQIQHRIQSLFWFLNINYFERVRKSEKKMIQKWFATF